MRPNSCRIFLYRITHAIISCCWTILFPLHLRLSCALRYVLLAVISLQYATSDCTCAIVRRSGGRVWRRSVGQRWRRLVSRSPASAASRQLEQRRQRHSRQQDQEDAQGAHGVHRSSTEHARAELRATEISQRAGPHGARFQTEPERHAGQNLVPEPQVS